jgi:hypothetical protein
MSVRVIFCYVEHSRDKKIVSRTNLNESKKHEHGIWYYQLGKL